MCGILPSPNGVSSSILPFHPASCRGSLEGLHRGQPHSCTNCTIVLSEPACSLSPPEGRLQFFALARHKALNSGTCVRNALHTYRHRPVSCQPAYAHLPSKQLHSIISALLGPPSAWYHPAFSGFAHSVGIQVASHRLHLLFLCSSSICWAPNACPGPMLVQGCSNREQRGALPLFTE